MNRTKTALMSSLSLCCSALIFGTLAFAAKSRASGEGINKLLVAAGAGVVHGVHVTRLSDGQTLYEMNADQLLTPASVTKVLTAATALTRFSPARTFKTRFYHTGERKDGRVLGDLIVVGDGDPLVISEKLWQLATDLRNMGIHEIKGDLIVDNSLFAGPSRDLSRMEGAKVSRMAYDAPVSAFGVNFNTYAVSVAPGAGMGKPALVNFDPYPLRHMPIENEVRTGNGKVSRAFDIKRIGGTGKLDERVVASGTIGVDMPLTKIYRSVGDPVRTAGEYLRAFFKGEGIVLTGQVKEGVKPAEARLLYELDGYDIRRIVASLNTFSNNYVADVLVKRLGAAFPKTGKAEAAGSGSFENGMAVIRDFLRQDAGVRGDIVLENGSGLSTENRLTARQVTTVLSYMEKRMDVFPDFLASLPATGWDGTMKKRFAKAEASDLKGQFRAKTGTLSEPIAVVALAGYFRHPKHGLTAFCMIENGKSGMQQPSIADLRDRQDQVLVSFLNEI